MVADLKSKVYQKLQFDWMYFIRSSDMVIAEVQTELFPFSFREIDAAEEVVRKSRYPEQGNQWTDRSFAAIRFKNRACHHRR